MTSCLYECQVLHARFSPRAHRFAYRLFYFALDLDELPALSRRLPLFSLGRANLYSFRPQDFHPTAPAEALGTSVASLKARLVAFGARHGADLAGARIRLVALPRIAGYLFNPVSFYFFTAPDGTPLAAIAEVTNTFREVKPYFLAADPAAPAGEFRLRVPKHFYVSPFSDVDVAFDFLLRLPGEKLSIKIDDYTAGTRTLTSTLAGRRRELTGARLAWYSVKYPLLTLRVIALIHWHALRLWLKRIPWFPKAGRPADQRDLYRPHSSLTVSDAT
jgi:hypothetical protein